MSFLDLKRFFYIKKYRISRNFKLIRRLCLQIKCIECKSKVKTIFWYLKESKQFQSVSLSLDTEELKRSALLIANHRAVLGEYPQIPYNTQKARYLYQLVDKIRTWEVL